MQDNNQQKQQKMLDNNRQIPQNPTESITNQKYGIYSQKEQPSRSIDLNYFKDDSASNPNSKGHQRRRRLKKKKVQHPPQYYEQLKIMKLNQARQTHWNGRFVYDTIPQLKRGRKTQKKVNNKTADQKIRTKEEKSPLAVKPAKLAPLVDKSHKNASKSFQIRNKIKNSGNTKSIQPIIDKTISQVQSNTGQIKGSKVEQNEKTQKYTKQIQSLYQSSQKNLFPSFYKELLIDVSYRAEIKAVKKFLDHQLIKIKNKQAQIFQTMRFIEMRQVIIQKLKRQCLQQRTNHLNQKQVQDYQQITLKCIEEILKWRQQIENLIRSAHLKNRRPIIFYNGQDYLSAIGNGLPFLNAKPYMKVNQTIVKKDPFLLSCLQSQDRSRLLKIRACELLLLQEQLRKET